MASLQFICFFVFEYPKNEISYDDSTYMKKGQVCAAVKPPFFSSPEPLGSQGELIGWP